MNCGEFQIQPFPYPIGQSNTVSFGAQARVRRSQIADAIGQLIIAKRLANRYFSMLERLAPCAESRTLCLQFAQWNMDDSNQLLRCYARYSGRSFMPRIPRVDITSYLVCLRQAQIHLNQMSNLYHSCLRLSCPTYMSTLLNQHYQRMNSWNSSIEHLIRLGNRRGIAIPKPY